MEAGLGVVRVGVLHRLAYTSKLGRVDNDPAVAREELRVARNGLSS